LIFAAKAKWIPAFAGMTMRVRRAPYRDVKKRAMRWNNPRFCGCAAIGIAGTFFDVSVRGARSVRGGRSVRGARSVRGGRSARGARSGRGPRSGARSAGFAFA
jgi:hypothetical protein